MNWKGYICIFSCLLIIMTGFSQTGPGGVGNAGNNSLWLMVTENSYVDSGTTLATDGLPVQQWNDISGNGNNAIQTNAAFKPIFKANRANGLPSLKFDGSDDRILSSGIAIAHQATFFIVANNASIVNGNDGIVHGAPSGNPFSTAYADKCVGIWVNRTGNKPWGRGVQSNGVGKDIPQTISISLGQFNILTQNYDGSNISQFVNQSIAGTISYDGTLKDWSEFGIGRQGTESMNGEISEVIVYTISLNSAQRIIVDNYLAAKYNLTLTSNDIYDGDDSVNGNYDHEVAGIGRVNASNLHIDAQGTGIIRISAPTNLNDNEFLMWGHDNGSLSLNNTTDVPGSLTHARLNRVWRVSEANNTGTAIDVGSIDLWVNMTGLTEFSTTNLPQLLIDTNNDGIFADENPISSAVVVGNNIYKFSGVSALTDNLRFTFALGVHNAITNKKITYRVKKN